MYDSSQEASVEMMMQLLRTVFTSLISLLKFPRGVSVISRSQRGKDVKTVIFSDSEWIFTPAARTDTELYRSSTVRVIQHLILVNMEKSDFCVNEEQHKTRSLNLVSSKVQRVHSLLNNLITATKISEKLRFCVILLPQHIFFQRKHPKHTVRTLFHFRFQFWAFLQISSLI